MDNKSSGISDVIVVGGGASGMMAAYAAARRGLSVELIEKNEKTGKKIYITGKGRCNLTNACEPDELLSHEMRNHKFLYSAFSRFSNRDLMELMEKAGCRLKVERGKRVFPLSDHASDVIKALNKLMREAGVCVILKSEVADIKKEEGFFSIKVRDTERRKTRVKRSYNLIIACGGLCYPSTGSTGDGYRFAESFGIKICRTSPSLTSLSVLENDETGLLAGLGLRNSRLRLLSGSSLICEDMGEILFTHRGLSGPLVLTASSYAAEEYLRNNKDLRVLIDLKPALDENKLDERLLREFKFSPDQTFKNILKRLLPASLVPVIIKRSGADAEQKACTVRSAERKAVIANIKALGYTVTGLGEYDEAVITKGGVDVSEIDPRTMGSKKIPGLYFVGEVLDIDALTGGFNLQNAFSTGFAAGDSVRRMIVKKYISVAIDGPSGVGKTTLAKKTADALEFIYVDTGAIYRTLAVYFIDNHIDPEDEAGMRDILNGADIGIKYAEGTQHMYLNGKDVTARLRTGEVSHMASVSSSYSSVREKLLSLQRSLAANANVVMDGRDIGTVVLPDADLKIFLTAEPMIRAGRRYMELESKNQLNNASLEDIARELEARDRRDSTRANAPLKPADDAIIVDSSDMTADEVAAIVITKVRELIGASKNSA